MLARPEPIKVVTPFFHPGQATAYKLPGLRKAIRCGRRWGKTDYEKIIASHSVINKQIVGIFAPDYKRLSETYTELDAILEPVKKSSSRTEGTLRTTTGGRIDFWTLEDESAGRSRKYHKVFIDEAAFAKPNMMDIWKRSIEPTLLDYRGSATVLSNTNGIDPENFFWQICNQPVHGFVQYHAPSIDNPYVPGRIVGLSDAEHEADRQKYFAELKAKTPPLVYSQEYEAKFVDWSGTAFFSLDKLLEAGQPVDYPARCDAVFAVIDTATKTGKENDGTGVIYFAFTKTGEAQRLVILDWDVIQIEGALLETWLPTIFSNLEAYARDLKARAGSLGAWIEDKASGMVLLQQAARRGQPAQAIDSKLTAVGKDERAISVSGYVYQGLVKLSRTAYEKVSVFKETSRNHLRGQVLGFRVGDKDASKQDDLLDCFTYGIALALGDSGGF